MAGLKEQFQLVGDKAIRKKLGRLSAGSAKKIMAPAVREGLKPVRKKAKENAQPGAV